jgi:hypothetical protein
VEAVELMTILAVYNKSIASSLTEGQQLLVEARAAARLGISLDAWRVIRSGTVSVELLREIHIAGTGRPANVRRADENGIWMMVTPKPGRLRSRPQSLRIGDHVEAAWDHNTLRKRLAELLRVAAIEMDGSPFEIVARTTWSLLRAQPFLGLNERTALLVAARLLHAIGFPVLPVSALEHDKDFASAACASDHGLLAEVFERAVWGEALDFAEWLPLSRETPRWSLHDEQRALATARERAPRVDAVVIDEVIDQLANKIPAQLATQLAMSVEDCVLSRPDAYSERLSIAVTSARCGRFICPQQPISHLRWNVSSTPLAAQVVIGSAGRGLTGAVSVHLALGIGEVLGRSPPTILLVPGETSLERSQRIDSWIGRAVAGAIANAPVRC